MEYRIWSQHGEGQPFITQVEFDGDTPHEAAQKRFEAMSPASQSRCTAILVKVFGDFHVYPTGTIEKMVPTYVKGVLEQAR